MKYEKNGSAGQIRTNFYEQLSVSVRQLSVQSYHQIVDARLAQLRTTFATAAGKFVTM
jgi:hypothetical protein